MIEKNLKGFKIFQFNKLQNDKNIFCAITTKIYNEKPVFDVEHYDISKNNLFIEFLKANNTNDYFYMNQAHTSNVLLLKNSEIKTAYNIDGVITQIKNKLLIGFSADCSLSLFYDKKSKAIGLCHAGWRGILLNIYENIFKNMNLHFGTKKENLFVGISPFISVDNYEVGLDLIKKFEYIYGKKQIKKIYKIKNNKYFFDIKSALKLQLKNLGIKNYEFSNICTYENNEIFHSYRKGDKGHFTMCTQIIE